MLHVLHTTSLRVEIRITNERGRIGYLLLSGKARIFLAGIEPSTLDYESRVSKITTHVGASRVACPTYIDLRVKYLLQRLESLFKSLSLRGKPLECDRSGRTAYEMLFTVAKARPVALKPNFKICLVTRLHRLSLEVNLQKAVCA